MMLNSFDVDPVVSQLFDVLHMMFNMKASEMNPNAPIYAESVDAERMIAAEKLEIENNSDRDGRSAWSGIALSGGGIRSAIFCLGAMQALGQKNILKHFDYMSSVSGGGYIASALQWLWHTNKLTGASKENFPFGTSRTLKCGEPAKDERLGYLRTHGEYLIPGDGLTIWSMTAVVIRTLFLNLIVWLPLVALVLFVSIFIFGFFNVQFSRMPNVFSPMLVKWQCSPCGATWPIETFFGVCIIVASIMAMIFTGWALGFSLDTTVSPAQDIDPTPQWQRRCYVLLQLVVTSSLVVAAVFSERSSKLDPYSQAVIIGFVAVSCLLLLVRVLQARGADASQNYLWRRRLEISSGKWLPMIVIVFAVGTLPIIPYMLANDAGPFMKTVAALIAAVSGIVSAVVGHGAQAQNKPPSDAVRWVLMCISTVFLYALGCIGYMMAQLVLDPIHLVGDDSFLQNVVRGGILALAGVAFVIGKRTNVNYVGLHRFYRDRLMEAFMPSADCVSANAVGRSPVADKLSVSDLWPPARNADGSKRPIPYPLVNTNAVFVNDDNRLIVSRGGDSFVISPLYVGSAATGWEQTSRFICKHGPLSLASAMAASGAALNANAAYVGAGVTRDRLLSIVLMLLNLRLGLWVGRPSGQTAGRVAAIPNHFNPGFRYGLTLSGYNSGSPFVELSDGGHFDNLGIYELVRREVSFIVVLDGEQDAPTSMPALYSVVQRIEEDFKVKIDLEGRLDDLVAQPHDGYPDGVRYVKNPFFAAPVHYPSGVTGVLVYVKLSLASGASFAAKGYRAQYPDFPHQPTANQFFVPQQIEAYRDVGYVNMLDAIEALGLNRTCEPSAVLREWSRHARKARKGFDGKPTWLKVRSEKRRHRTV